MRGGGNGAGGPPRHRVKLPPSGWGAPDPAAVSGPGTAPRRCPAGLAQSLRRGGASPLRQLRRGLARLLRTIWFWVPCPKVSDLGKFLSSVIYRGGGSHSNRRVTAWPPATPHARRCRSRPRRRLPGRVRCGARRAAHNKPGQGRGRGRAAGPQVREAGAGRGSAREPRVPRARPGSARAAQRRAPPAAGHRAPARSTPGEIRAGEMFPSSLGEAGGMLRAKDGSRYSPRRACFALAEGARGRAWGRSAVPSPGWSRALPQPLLQPSPARPAPPPQRSQRPWGPESLSWLICFE